MYVYNAKLVRVHDADTVVLDVDLGFYTWRRSVSARLAGISARELSMPGGPEAAAYLTALLPPGTPLIVRSFRLNHDPADVMSFDRYVMFAQLVDGADIGKAIVAAGYAVPWDGRSKPTPYPAWPVVTGGPA